MVEAGRRDDDRRLAEGLFKVVPAAHTGLLLVPFIVVVIGAFAQLRKLCGLLSSLPMEYRAAGTLRMDAKCDAVAKQEVPIAGGSGAEVVVSVPCACLIGGLGALTAVAFLQTGQRRLNLAGQHPPREL
jgi:hypothetical protein